MSGFAHGLSADDLEFALRRELRGRASDKALVAGFVARLRRMEEVLYNPVLLDCDKQDAFEDELRAALSELGQ